MTCSTIWPARTPGINMKREPQTNLAKKDVLFQYEEPQTNLAKKDALFQYEEVFFISI